MSTPFYDLASLVVVPSGYKASKVYAQKPLTTDGQLAFTRSTTATRVNSAGLIEASAVNVPRLDYLGSSCPRLLLEPQRTNLVTYSEQIDNVAWVKGAYIATLTVTANQSTAPDGTMSADKVVLSAITGVNTYAVVAQAFTATAAAFSGSFYFKGENGGEVIYISYTKDGVTYTRQLCTLTTSWQRFTLTSTLTAGADNLQFGVDRRDGSQAATPAQTFYVWGCQLEAGAYATSYIPTTTAAVTRAADAASKTGISSLIGQTEGTLFVEFNATGLAPSNARINLSDETNANWVFISIESNKLRGFVRANSVTIFSDETISPTSNNKVAVAYKSGSIALYINGVQILTGASTFTFSSPLVQFGTNLGASNQIADAIVVNQSLLFKTRLTNAQLAELTTI